MPALFSLIGMEASFESSAFGPPIAGSGRRCKKAQKCGCEIDLARVKSWRA